MGYHQFQESRDCGTGPGGTNIPYGLFISHSFLTFSEKFFLRSFSSCKKQIFYSLVLRCDALILEEIDNFELEEPGQSGTNPK